MEGQAVTLDQTPEGWDQVAGPYEKQVAPVLGAFNVAIGFR